MRYPEIYVLRHGQTEWNAVGRHQGQLDSPLTAKGRAQAAHMGRILAERPLPAELRVFASPSGRARDTADIACGPLGRDITHDARLMEVGFGKWEGLTAVEIDAQFPEMSDKADDMFGWHFTSPDGETFDQMHSRVSGFLNDLATPAIIVTHGITSRLLRGIWLGLDFAGMRDLTGGQGCIYHLNDGKLARYD